LERRGSPTLVVALDPDSWHCTSIMTNSISAPSSVPFRVSGCRDRAVP
jgi:hypothetical protein